ncbi:MAG: methyltransferase domain-containing protein [Waddliaceae bacterium]
MIGYACRLKRALAKGILPLALGCSVLFYSGELTGAVEKSEKIVAADQLLEQNMSIEDKYGFEFHGRRFIGYPDVYSPIIFGGANKQTDININEGERFLELGCGTGVFSVLAALEGAKGVVAVDINAAAVANTLENAKLHGVDNKVTVLQGDMFLPLAKEDLFDVIFFNIPFCHRNCDASELTMLGRSLYDPEHDLLHRYFREGKENLAPGGRMLLGYSTTHGDIELMHQWADAYDWEVKLLHKFGDEKIDFFTVELYECRPRL